MYLKYYGLTEEPFGVTPDPRFLYLSRGHREAHATLEYGMRTARGFTALVAKPGMGKTSLLFRLLEQHASRARTAFLFQTQCDSREFMRYLLAELGLDIRNADFVGLQDEFNHLLVRECNAGRQVIVVVDEAQNLSSEVLETVRLLSDFETPRAKLLHIILAGQPELADKLASTALLQLRQRISHLIRLEPFSPREVEEYIQHRLRTAGYSGEPLFTREATKVIAQRSEGVPRNINNLCFNALSLAFALGRKLVDVPMLHEVSADLDFEAATRDLRRDFGASQQLDADAEEFPPEETAAQADISSEETDKKAVEHEAVEAKPVHPPDPGSPRIPKKEPQPAPAINDQPLRNLKRESLRIENAPRKKEPAAHSQEAAFTEAPLSAVHQAERPSTRICQPQIAASVPAFPPDQQPTKKADAKAAEILETKPAAAADPKTVKKPSVSAETAPVPANGKSAVQSPALPTDEKQNGNATQKPNGKFAEKPNGKAEAKQDVQQEDKQNGQSDDKQNGQTVDVDAIARDVAMLGMEKPKRWSRPVPTTRPAQSPITSPPKKDVRPIAANSATAPVAPVLHTPAILQQPPAPAVRPAAPVRIEPRPNPMLRSYLTAGVFMLAILLVWLMTRSPRAAVPGPENTIVAGSGTRYSGALNNGENASAVSTQVGNTRPLSNGTQDQPSSSVLDIVDEVPTLAGVADADTSGVPSGRSAGGRRSRLESSDQLVRRVDPVYPPAAKLARIQGPVVLQASIATDGTLRHIRVLNGEPLLAQAALDAVKDWRYRPRMVRGKAVEVSTQITLNFKLVANPRLSSANP